MNVESVPIESVSQLDRNPRRHPERQLAELVKSIEQFGQYRPLVVDENGVILAGNGLHVALVRAGVSTVSVYRMVGLSESQKTKLVLADNKTGDLSNDDFGVIEALLSELDDFEVPGYDPDTLRELMLTADQALESAQEYGVLSDADREVLNSRTDGVEGDRTQASVGTPPGPVEEEEEETYGIPAHSGDSGSVVIDFTMGTPLGDALADEVEERRESGAACPACGRGW